MREGLRSDAFSSEAAVSQGILLSALHELGWPVFDISVVVPEFSLEGGRVDFALCHPTNKPAVFVEVKRVGRSDRDDKQLFEYAFHQGVPVAILTDGQEWSFYLPAEQGHYTERRVYKLNLLERNIEDAASRLERYLSYERVCSGEALGAARSDYQTVARQREIEAALPKAWSALLEERDSSLLELLANKVEGLCGYKPASDVCSQFLEGVSEPRVVTPAPNPDQFSNHLVREAKKPRAGRYRADAVGGINSSHLVREAKKPPSGVRTRAVVSFTFRGETHECSSAAEVMRQVFRLLAEEDPGFLEHFAVLKHGKKRRYLDQDRRKLYPGKPSDFALAHSFEVAHGWWLGTHYSRKSIRGMLDLALEVAHPSLRSVIKFNVGA